VLLDLLFPPLLLGLSFTHELFLEAGALTWLGGQLFPNLGQDLLFLFPGGFWVLNCFCNTQPGSCSFRVCSIIRRSWSSRKRMCFWWKQTVSGRGRGLPDVPDGFGSCPPDPWTVPWSSCGRGRGPLCGSWS